jgi:esterase/lipase
MNRDEHPYGSAGAMLPKALARVPCPVLIMQTLDDDTVQPKSADYIYSRIQGEKSLVKLERGGHYVLRTDVAPDVCLGIQTAIDK